MDQRYCFSGDDELSEYLDGVIGEKRGSELQGHLDDCPDCFRRFHVARGLKALLSESRSGVAAPPWLKPRIISSIAAEPATGANGLWDYLTGAIRGRPAVPVIAVLALVVVLFAAVLYRAPHGSTMPLVAELVEEHYEYLNGPGENGFLSKDIDEISGWMAVNAGFTISDFCQRELPSPNSACVIKEDGETIGYVGFDYQDQKVSLFLLKEDQGRLFGPRKTVLSGVDLYCGDCTGMNYVFWRGGEFMYVLVGKLPENSLVELAGKMI